MMLGTTTVSPKARKRCGFDNHGRAILPYTYILIIPYLGV